MTTSTDMHKIHHGRNIRRFREMLGLKQEALATELGGEWTQRRVSLLEGKELVEDEILSEVAGALKVPKEAIENFDEEAVVTIVTNTFSDFKDSAVASPVGINYLCSFNPIDKLVELFEENKKLYERLLESERDKVQLLQRLLDKK